MNYEENQKGGVISIALILAMAGLIVTFFLKEDEGRMSSLAFIAMTVCLAVVYALFSSLKTQVGSGEIQLKYGVGLIRKQILIRDISEVKVVRNKWFYGWGIRFYGSGWLWNYSGLDAVELSFKDRNLKFRIGSRNAEKLKLVIEENLTN